MRYQLYKDDIGNFLIVDSMMDQIISKVKNEKIAVKVIQKINKNDMKEKNITKSHWHLIHKTLLCDYGY